MIFSLGFRWALERGGGRAALRLALQAGTTGWHYAGTETLAVRWFDGWGDRSGDRSAEPMMRERELQCLYCLSPGRRGAPSLPPGGAWEALRGWVYDPETVISRTISPTVQRQLTALGALFGRVRSGSGSVLMIEGAAGMGKSRLIGEGLIMAARLSFPVGIGTAEPSESMAELAAASGAFRRPKAVA